MLITLLTTLALAQDIAPKKPNPPQTQGEAMLSDPKYRKQLPTAQAGQDGLGVSMDCTDPKTAQTLKAGDAGYNECMSAIQIDPSQHPTAGGAAQARPTMRLNLGGSKK
jgi:hypothetical protein